MNLWLRAVLPILGILATGAAAAWVARIETRRDRQRELARRNVERTVRTAVRTVRTARRNSGRYDRG